jgi:hypothetical protein
MLGAYKNVDVVFSVNSYNNNDDDNNNNNNNNKFQSFRSECLLQTFLDELPQ